MQAEKLGKQEVRLQPGDHMVEFFQGKVVFILLVFQMLFSAMGGESCGLAPVFCHFVLGRVFSVHLSALRLLAVHWPD